MSPSNVIEGYVWKAFSSPPWILEIIDVEGEEDTGEYIGNFRKDL